MRRECELVQGLVEQGRRTGRRNGRPVRFATCMPGASPTMRRRERFRSERRNGPRVIAGVPLPPVEMLSQARTRRQLVEKSSIIGLATWC